MTREDRVRADLRDGLWVTDLPALVRVAVADARCLDREVYLPWSSEWHKPLSGGICQVCLAGAVIADTLDSTEDMDLVPDSFDNYTRDALDALDQVRRGHVDRAMDILLGDRFGTSGRKNGLDDELREHRDWLSFGDWAEFDDALDRLEVLADSMDTALGMD